MNRLIYNICFKGQGIGCIHFKTCRLKSKVVTALECPRFKRLYNEFQADLIREKEEKMLKMIQKQQDQGFEDTFDYNSYSDDMDIDEAKKNEQMWDIQ